MDFIFEFLFELIVDGAVEALGEKKVPMVLRVLAAVIVFAVFGGLIVFFAMMSIMEKNVIYAIAGAVFAVLFGAFIWKTVKKHREKDTSREES